MRPGRLGVLAVAGVSLVLALTGGSASAHSTKSPCCAAIEHWNGNVWKPVASPDLSGAPLNAVAAISAKDLWAVGGSHYSGAPVVAEHWSGSTWSTVPVPLPSASGFNMLSGVSGTSASDVWAVGTSANETLIEHWDGQAWTRVPSPSAPANVDARSYLTGVVAISPTNAWAVGSYEYCVSGRFCGVGSIPPLPALVLHWNGTQWQYAPAGALTKYAYPDGSLDAELSAVDAVSPHHIWAVGTGALPQAYTPTTLVGHWDGNGGNTIQPSGSSSDAGSWLSGVTALTATQAWAVGGHYKTQNAPAKPLVERWNGHAWRAVQLTGVTLPRSPHSYQSLHAAAAISAKDVWAVGEAGYYANPNAPVVKTLIEHWDGRHWTAVPAQDPTPVYALYGVAAVSANDVWAVGSY